LWRGGNAPAAGKVHGVRLEETPMRSPVLVMISALLVGGAAQAAEPAQAPVVTAPAAAPSTADQIDAFIKAQPIPTLEPDAAPGVTSSTDDRKVHGVVELGVGSNGYRHAYVRSDMPLGDSGSLSIAVDETRFHGRFGQVQSRSLGVGLAFGEAARTTMPCRRPGEPAAAAYAPLDAPDRSQRLCAAPAMAPFPPR
jgi:hypothetical protein